MAGYRRFIAYVYEYPEGKKGNGKGFIKVESRDGICRMQYKLSGIYGSDPIPAKIYGYVRENQSCKGILLGECDMAGDSIQFEHEMPSKNIGGSSYALEDLCGLILITDFGMMYGSGWDDKPIQLQEISLPDAGMVQAAEKEIVPEQEVQEQEVQEQEAPEAELEQQEPEYQESGMINAEIVDTESLFTEEEPVAGRPETQERPAEEEENIPEHMPEEEEATQPESVSSCFCDNSFSSCRKISSGDFKFLNRRDQGLLYNNFLRHGFSRHGHILLAKREEDGKYILGVPGVYERQEALMANMFGFPYFKETKGCQSGKTRFGYWYRFIENPNLEEA